MEPAPLTWTFTGFTVPTSGTQNWYFDLSQIASIVNRRFYRQGLNWAVAGFKVISASGSNGSIVVSKVPNTWVASGAWEKSMRAWLTQQDEALERLDDPAPARFRDFKILLDEAHVAQYVAAGSDLNATNQLPPGALPGEWEASQIVIPNDGGVGITNEYNLHMVGSNVATSKAMISGYANSRNTPHSPDPVSPGPLDNNFFNRMFDVGDNSDEIVENATDKNDNLPYDRDDYPGETANQGAAEVHDLEYITPTTIGGTTRLKGGNFPCGLVKMTGINFSESDTLDFTLHIDLVPGHHRGYLCEPMTEM